MVPTLWIVLAGSASPVTGGQRSGGWRTWCCRRRTPRHRSVRAGVRPAGVRVRAALVAIAVAITIAVPGIGCRSRHLVVVHLPGGPVVTGTSALAVHTGATPWPGPPGSATSGCSPLGDRPRRAPPGQACAAPCSAVGVGPGRCGRRALVRPRRQYRLRRRRPLLQRAVHRCRPLQWRHRWASVPQQTRSSSWTSALMPPRSARTKVRHTAEAEPADLSSAMPEASRRGRIVPTGGCRSRPPPNGRAARVLGAQHAADRVDGHIHPSPAGDRSTTATSSSASTHRALDRRLGAPGLAAHTPITLGRM